MGDLGLPRKDIQNVDIGNDLERSVKTPKLYVESKPRKDTGNE